MHPRNIYRTPPNFSELRRIFPEFAEKVEIDVGGKLKLDFKNIDAVRCLTRCCLKKDFNLDVEIPPDKLLPTLPLRINYILWIEDLLSFCGLKDDIIGIDIGTGAIAIYCLLSVRMNNNWRMFGLEIDSESIDYANKNVLKNQLDSKIKIIENRECDKIFKTLFAADDNIKTFTVCNPPFFSSKEEMSEGQNRTGKRKQVSKTVKESSETVFMDGGEFGFVSKIFEESTILRDKIAIYTTMFGCKKNFQKFLSLIKSHNIDNFTTTELVQGKVIRWAVAWSFSYGISNFRSHPHKAEKLNVLKHVIDNAKFDDVKNKVLKILNDLKINIKSLDKESRKGAVQYELEAFENTWTNQRRKRRAADRNNEQSSHNGQSTESLNMDNLKIGFELKAFQSNSVHIQMYFIEGSMSKDCVNQILQYIKNNLLKN